ncbi:MAG: PepSY domain-containing protein [Azospirillaceae bacterium]
MTTLKRVWQAGVIGVVVAATAGTVAVAADVVAGSSTGAARALSSAPGTTLVAESGEPGERGGGDDYDDDRGGREEGAMSGDTDRSGSAGADIGVEGAIAAVTGAGYSDIREVEREGRDYEVKARDADGRLWELYVDAGTGEILDRERD